MRLSPALALLACLSTAQGCIEDRPRTVAEEFCSAHCELRDGCWEDLTNVPNCRQECLEDRLLQRLSDEALELYDDCMNDSQCADLKPPEVGMLLVQDCVRKAELTEPGEDTFAPSTSLPLGEPALYHFQCPADPKESTDIVGVPPEEATEQMPPSRPPPETPAACLDEVFDGVRSNDQCEDLCDQWTSECSTAPANCLTLLCPWDDETLVEFESCLEGPCSEVDECLDGILGVLE